ncbi:MAG: hypothetical protein WD069_10930 [Planctomycetales bacterium]
MPPIINLDTRRSSRAIGALALTALLAAGGCAPQYHWYRGGGCCVGYGYCPPAPLPYTSYSGCPTPVASGYAWRQPMGAIATIPAADAGVPDAALEPDGDRAPSESP